MDNQTNPATDKRVDYTAFGTVDAESGENDSKSPYRYAGNSGYYDGSGRSATTTADGMILCGHRWYDPEVGRWLTEDPDGFTDGWNLYEYCGSCPGAFIDPMGDKKRGWPIHGVVKNKSSVTITVGADGKRVKVPPGKSSKDVGVGDADRIVLDGGKEFHVTARALTVSDDKHGKYVVSTGKKKHRVKIKDWGRWEDTNLVYNLLTRLYKIINN